MPTDTLIIGNGKTAKKKPLPRSMDRCVLRRGMRVWCIQTRDYGQTWTVREDRILAVKPGKLALAQLKSMPVGWVHLTAESRIFVRRERAEAEIRRRHKWSLPMPKTKPLTAAKVRAVLRKAGFRAGEWPLCEGYEVAEANRIIRVGSVPPDETLLSRLEKSLRAAGLATRRGTTNGGRRFVEVSRG